MKKKVIKYKEEIASILICCFFFFMGFISRSPKKEIHIQTRVDTVYVDTNVVTFENELLSYCDRAHIRFPKIVVAQSILETGWFKSRVFFENNNLFGMKECSSRPTTQISVDANGYAVYSSYWESILDYAIWQAKYCSCMKTEEQYLDYLLRAYSKDKDYINKLKNISSKL